MNTKPSTLLSQSNVSKSEDHLENYEVQVINSFEDMNLKINVLRGIYSCGYEKPSAIQQRAIVPLVKHHDVIAQAQSGTGKTATFAISALELFDTSSDDVQVMILSPTRDLANQTANVIRDIGNYLEVRVLECIGGMSISENIRAIHHDRPQFIVGTPGRVKDLIDRGDIDPQTVHLFILDEADEMLSRGFADQIYDITTTLPTTTQIALFSATMTDDALNMAGKFMNHPIRILIQREEITLEGIAQYYINLEDTWKFETLCDLYENIHISQCVIFCNTRRGAESLAQQMIASSFSVSCIHSELSQHDRNSVVKQFREGVSRVLISTDVFARGLDVHGVSIVINYDLPKSVETYIHRIGRCGRFGRKGLAINFVNRRESSVLSQLESHYHTEIAPLPENISDLI